MKKLFGNFDARSLVVKQLNTKYSLPSKLSSKANKVWSELLKQSTAKGSRVWNGPIYRLAKITKKNNKCFIDVNETDFKSHYATPFISEGLMSFPFKQRPNGIFVTAYVITNDRRIILSMKSNTSTLRNNINLVGGNLSTDDTCITCADDIFDSYSREFSEETGLDQKYIDKIKGLGIWLTDSLRIGIFLTAELDLSSEEFLKKAKPNFEHKNFIIVELNELEKLNEKVYGMINPYIPATVSSLLGVMHISDETQK